MRIFGVSRKASHLADMHDPQEPTCMATPCLFRIHSSLFLLIRTIGSQVAFFQDSRRSHYFLGTTMKTQRGLSLSFSSLILLWSSWPVRVSAYDLQCSVTEEIDPNIKMMEYDIGYGPQSVGVYVEPDVTTFYKKVPPPASKPVKMKFDGLFTKFINMSRHPVGLYW
jgi:hypothetical protein